MHIACASVFFCAQLLEPIPPTTVGISLFLPIWCDFVDRLLPTKSDPPNHNEMTPTKSQGSVEVERLDSTNQF